MFAGCKRLIPDVDELRSSYARRMTGTWNSDPRRNVAAKFVMVALIVAGCSSDTPSEGPDSDDAAPGPEPSQSAAASAPPPQISPSDSAQALAIAAYQSMWEDYATAAETSDWQWPRLADHATGEALSVMSRGLYASSYNGLVSRGKPVLNPQVTSVDPPDDPTTVTISDCGDSSNWLRYDAETGELAEDEEGGRRAITAKVEVQPDGVWKVTGFAVQELGSC